MIKWFKLLFDSRIGFENYIFYLLNFYYFMDNFIFDEWAHFLKQKEQTIVHANLLLHCLPLLKERQFGEFKVFSGKFTS